MKDDLENELRSLRPMPLPPSARLRLEESLRNATRNRTPVSRYWAMAGAASFLALILITTMSGKRMQSQQSLPLVTSTPLIEEDGQDYQWWRLEALCAQDGRLMDYIDHLPCHAKAGNADISFTQLLKEQP